MENENCTRHIFSAVIFFSSRLSKVFVGVLLYSRRNFPTDFIVLPFLSPRIFLIASRAEFAKTALLNTTAFTLFLFLSPGFCSHSLASLQRQKVPTHWANSKMRRNTTARWKFRSRASLTRFQNYVAATAAIPIVRNAGISNLDHAEI